MKKYEKIYKELRKKYSDEEIAQSMLIPADMTKSERSKSDEELRAFRFKMLNAQTEEERIYSDLLKFRYQMESYIKEQAYTATKSFGNHLEEYVRILKQTKKKLSEDLGIHYTRLSRIINDREEANLELIYRLEKHSGNLIPALLWWKLISKKQEFMITQDKKMRKKEGSKVKSVVKYRA